MMTGRKCCPFFCKCIGFTMLTFVFFAVLAMAYVYKVLTDVVEEFTIETDTPWKFPVVTMSERDLYIVANRVEDFLGNITDGEAGIEDLVLSQDEINGFVNGLIGHSDYQMITIRDNQIVEEFRLPMGVLGFDDRYFAGYNYFDFGILKSDGEDGYDKKNIVEVKTMTEAKHNNWFDGPLVFLQLQYLVTEDKGHKFFELFFEKGYVFGCPPVEERQKLFDSEGFRKVLYGIEHVSIEKGKIVIKARNPSSKSNIQDEQQRCLYKLNHCSTSKKCTPSPINSSSSPNISNENFNNNSVAQLVKSI